MVVFVRREIHSWAGGMEDVVVARFEKFKWVNETYRVSESKDYWNTYRA